MSKDRQQHTADRQRARWFSEHVLPAEPKVRQWLARSGWRGEDAEDLIQEAYAKLAECDWEAIANPAGYFFQTVRNLAAGIIRRNRIIPIHSVADIELKAGPDPGPDIDERLSSIEELRRLAAVIERLPPACRRVFVMRKIDRMPQAAVAEELGVTESNVEKHVARGIRLCAAEFAKPQSESKLPAILSNWSRKNG